MTLACYLLLPLLFVCQLLFHSAQASDCSASLCGGRWEVGFPFAFTNNPDCWGLSVMNCTGPEPKVQFNEQGRWYRVDYFNYWNLTITIHDEDLQSRLESNRCDLLNNFTKQVSPFLSFNFTNTRPFFKCKREPYPFPPTNFFNAFHNYTSCRDYDIYFYDNPEMSLPSLLSLCPTIVQSSIFHHQIFRPKM